MPSDETLRGVAEKIIVTNKKIIDVIDPPEPLWKRKFEPITEQPEPENPNRPIYILRSIFSHEQIRWIQQENFNDYLRFLEFRMTPDGVKRYIEGKEVEQSFFDQ